MEENLSLNIKILGSGTSGGVPIIACECEVCTSENVKDKRLRSSILINFNGKNVVIDAGPDFRTQMLHSGVKKLDAIFLTHEHRDHLSGLDDIRYFTNMNNNPMPIFARKQVLDEVVHQFPYAFGENAYRGGPRMQLRELKYDKFLYNDEEIKVINAVHGKISVVGFRIGNFAYLTDFNYISDEEKRKLKGLDVLVVGCLRKTKHVSHMSLSEIYELVDEVKPKRTCLTHIGHQLGKHADVEAELPEGIELCFDGKKIMV
jgi:phosphoribosyl 1,2-cyclic phosphate phosphodiesterase